MMTILAYGIFRSFFMLVFIIQISSDLYFYRMDAFGIIPNTPVCLKPSPPAHIHQLTYNHLHKNIMKEQIQKNRVANLLKQIDKLSVVIRQQQGAFLEQKQVLMKQVLLLSIQIQHQREIVGRYDAQLRKLQTGMEDIHSVYELKLQTLKREMIEHFEQQMSNEKQRTFEQLNIIRDNYKTKLALIAQSHKDKQHQLDLRGEKQKDLLMKIQFMSSRIAEKDKLNQTQYQKIAYLQQKADGDRQQLMALKQKLSAHQQQSQTQIEVIKKQLNEANAIKEEAYEQFRKLKETVDNYQSQKSMLINKNQELKEEAQLNLRKFLKAQKQFDQLQRKYDEKSLSLSINKKEQSQMKNEEWDMFNSKETKRERGSQATQNYKAIVTENEALQLRVKENEQLIKQLKIQIQELEDKCQQLMQKKLQQNEVKSNSQQLRKKNEIIEELKKQIEIQGQEQKKQLQFLNKKMNSFEKMWEQKEKDLPIVIKMIEDQYLKEIQEKKNKVLQLQDTLKATNQMFEKQIIKQNDSRSKGKRN